MHTVTRTLIENSVQTLIFHTGPHKKAAERIMT